MTVADRLGQGSSFGKVRNHRLSERGRAKAIAEGSIPDYELVRVQLTDVAPTPLNPRRNFGTEADQTAFGESLRKAQLAACTGVTRAAYLALWPEHEQQIGAAEVVLINGERRFRCAVHVGLEALDFVLRDELATSREDFIDNLLKENLDREDFDVMERARGVAQLVDVCAGNQAAAAGRLGRDRSWVTNQLILLTLPDEIQALLSAGMPERDGRRIARHFKDNGHLTAAELVEWLEAAKADERQARQAEKDLVRRAREDVLSADNTQSPAAAPTDVPEASPVEASPVAAQDVLSADNTQSPAPAAAHPQAPATASSAKHDAPAMNPVLSADNTPAQEKHSDPASASGTTRPSPASPTPVESTASIPHQGSPSAALTWSDLGSLADLLFANLQPDELDELVQLVADRLASQSA
ncbi:ParB family chromosome partitioning protein [Streptacidiphilus sp. MAP12-33]|uniref:ParB/RepB/Spo0J family partition protein n=1 Tax=Streptacidiphilus sp. MAP12-33 TaxID=3156266 RepID=UPI003516DA12